MAITNSPNMNLPIPGVGTEPGPNYAFDVNASFTLLDQHDHSPGRGIQITPAGLNINAALSIQGNDLTFVNSTVFQAQAGDNTLLALYVKPGTESPTPIQDLWFNDGVGNAVQLTSNGLVNATIGSLPGESYAFGTFFWKQGTGSTVPANFDIGSITLRPNIAATTYGVLLSPPSSITSQYTINLPLLPAADSFLTISNSGVMSASILTAGGITGSNIGLQTITAANIANNTITSGQIAHLTFIDGLATASFSTYTPSFVVRAATTVAGTLASSFHNLSVIDGITLATNDLILIKNQVTSSEDGVYVVQASGAPVRSSSYNTAAQINYAGVHVQLGTVNVNTNWFQNLQLVTLADPQSWSKAATQAFTVPAGVTQVILIGYGGGSGGGSGSGDSGGSGGGGGGAAIQSTAIVPVTPGQIIPVTQGYGGLGGIGSTGSGTIGAAGTDTTFGSLYTFKGNKTGGSGGVPGSGPGGNGSPFQGGSGGAVAIGGAQGAPSSTGVGGTGGSGAGTGGGGGGGGAGSILGGNSGNGGDGGNGGIGAGAPGSSAADLSGGGGGGGGGSNFPSGSPTGGNGGQGGSGYILVAWTAFN